MAKVKVKPENLGRVLQDTLRLVKRSVVKGVQAGAVSGERLLVSRTPTDRGELRRGWRTRPGGPKVPAVLHNDAPHAGIVEGGARPHPVSREGVESIMGWVRRNIGGDPEQVKRITWGIVRKLRRRGQEGTFFIRDSLDDLSAMTKVQVDARLDALSRRPPR